MKKIIILAITHLAFAAAGFALGIYMLPILTAPAPPSQSEMAAAADQVRFQGSFRRDLEGSDFLHWGEGTLSLGDRYILLEGEIAPGPDYFLYLSPEFVETEAQFNRMKDRMTRVGPVKTFENFVVPVPASVDLAAFGTAVVWCESFGEFITAAEYSPVSGGR